MNKDFFILIVISLLGYTNKEGPSIPKIIIDKLILFNDIEKLAVLFLFKKRWIKSWPACLGFVYINKAGELSPILEEFFIPKRVQIAQQFKENREAFQQIAAACLGAF